MYDSIDQSVTVEHQGTEVARQRARADLLTGLVVDYPRETDASGAYAVLKARFPDHVVKLRGDTVEFGEMSFEHQNGTLRRVVPY